MEEIEVVQSTRLSEDDLFRLDEYMDELLRKNQRFKDDGVLHLTLDSGEGTSLEELLQKFSGVMADSLKKLNPTTVPYCQDFYGHMSFDQLDTKEAQGCMDILMNPAMYTVSDANCCISALNETGINGLLSHYFEEKLPAEAKNPPQYKRVLGMGSDSAKKSALKFKTLTRRKEMLNKLKTPAEKSAAVCKVLPKGKANAELPEDNQYCSCWMCVYSDEVLTEEGDEMKPEIAATLMYYKDKGFYYASGINVKAGKWNRVS